MAAALLLRAAFLPMAAAFGAVAYRDLFLCGQELFEGERFLLAGVLGSENPRWVDGAPILVDCGGGPPCPTTPCSDRALLISGITGSFFLLVACLNLAAVLASNATQQAVAAGGLALTSSLYLVLDRVPAKLGESLEVQVDQQKTSLLAFGIVYLNLVLYTTAVAGSARGKAKHA